jgi:hypothetical protein
VRQPVREIRICRTAIKLARRKGKKMVKKRKTLLNITALGDNVQEFYEFDARKRISKYVHVSNYRMNTNSFYENRGIVKTDHTFFLFVLHRKLILTDTIRLPLTRIYRALTKFVREYRVSS